MTASAVIGRDEVVAAAGRIAPFVRRTPVVDVEGGALGVDAAVSLKPELLQRTGSFKARGAFNALLGGDGRVVAASGGNFGLAVAFAAAELRRPATIVVTGSTAPAKLEHIRALGVRMTHRRYAQLDAEASAPCPCRDFAARLWSTSLRTNDPTGWGPVNR